MVQLQERLKDIEATGGRIVAVSYDSPEIIKRFAAKSSVTLPLLADVGSKTIDAYGIRNREAPERIKGVPHPGTFIISKDGVVREKIFLEGYKDRHAPEAVIEALKKSQR